MAKRHGVRGLVTLSVAAAALSVLSWGCGRSSGPEKAKVIKLSHITSYTSHWHKGGERFAELVGQRTGGRYEVKLYPDGQIANGNQRTELQMLQTGTVEMSFESPIILALFMDKRFDAFSMPWLFPDLATARRACTGELGSTARGWLKEKGLVGLGVGVNGFRQLTNAKQAVRKPEDLKGIKFRVAGTDLFIGTFRLLGANALKMNFPEVFTSLQEGVIDGQENPLAIIYTSKLYEVQKHLTLWNYAFDPIILCVNGEFWNSISPADQAVMEKCAQEAMDYQWNYSEKLESNILSDLEGKGMAVIELSKDELAAFRSKVEPIYQKLESEDSLGKDLVSKWKAAVAKAAEEGESGGGPAE